MRPQEGLFKVAVHPLRKEALAPPGEPQASAAPCSPYKRRRCVYLSMDTLHLKYPLILFGSEGSALTLPLFHLEQLCFVIILQQ